MKRRTLTSKAVLFLFLAFGTLSCGGGSDDNPITPGTNGNIESATGTFKGKMVVYPHDDTFTEYFDAEVVVTKVGDDKLRVTPKAGQPYSNATPKTFEVTYIAYGSEPHLFRISQKAGSLEGHFTYNNDGKTLNILTKRQAETEAEFNFQGIKQ